MKQLFHGFRARVFWSISMLGIGLSMFFLTANIYQQMSLLKQDMIDKGTSAVNNLAHNSRLGVFAESNTLLEEAVRRITDTEKEIAYTSVYNIDGKRIDISYEEMPSIYSTVPSEVLEIIRSEKKPYWRKTKIARELYEFWVPVTVSENAREADFYTSLDDPLPARNKVIGYAHVALSTDNIDRQMMEVVGVSFSISAIFLPISMLITFFLAKKIAAPLHKLRQGIEIIESGKEYEQVPVTSQDEFGDLALSINRMVESLKKKDAEIMHHIQELSAMNTVAAAVNTVADLDAKIMEALKEVLWVTGLKSGWVQLIDDNELMLKLMAHTGVHDNFIKSIEKIPIGEGISGKVAVTGRPFISANISEHASVSIDAGLLKEEFNALACFPLRSKEKIVGIMTVASRQSHTFPNDEVELLHVIGNQVGTAIENAGLYETLKKQLNDIKRTQEQLVRSARLASLGELSANVAHEINNPLTGVLMYTSMLIDEFPENDDKLDKLRIIYDETMRIRYIVRNLLDFARHSEPRRDLANIVDVIRDTLSLVQHLAKVSDIKVVEQYAAADNPHNVSVDISQIKQVLLNMFNNAIHAMPDGGTMTIKTEAVERRILVRIADTGSGIHSDIIGKIFDPFFTTKPETKGTGLGLAISHRIIESHGGNIHVKSEYGKGSEFTISLPIQSTNKER